MHRLGWLRRCHTRIKSSDTRPPTVRELAYDARLSSDKTTFTVKIGSIRLTERQADLVIEPHGHYVPDSADSELLQLVLESIAQMYAPNRATSFTITVAALSNAIQFSVPDNLSKRRLEEYMYARGMDVWMPIRLSGRRLYVIRDDGAQK